LTKAYFAYMVSKSRSVGRRVDSSWQYESGTEKGIRTGGFGNTE